MLLHDTYRYQKNIISNSSTAAEGYSMLYMIFEQTYLHKLLVSTMCCQQPASLQCKFRSSCRVQYMSRNRQHAGIGVCSNLPAGKQVSGTLTYSFCLCSCLQTGQASGTCRPAEQLTWQGLACHVSQHSCSRWLLGCVCHFRKHSALTVVLQLMTM